VASPYTKHQSANGRFGGYIGHHRYDPADFGWTYDGLAAEFQDYTARYL